MWEIQIYNRRIKMPSVSMDLGFVAVSLLIYQKQITPVLQVLDVIMCHLSVHIDAQKVIVATSNGWI